MRELVGELSLTQQHNNSNSSRHNSSQHTTTLSALNSTHVNLVLFIWGRECHIISAPWQWKEKLKWKKSPESLTATKKQADAAAATCLKIDSISHNFLLFSLKQLLKFHKVAIAIWVSSVVVKKSWKCAAFVFSSFLNSFNFSTAAASSSL